MCFELYAGTKNPLPETPWNQPARDVHVEQLTDAQAALISHHFSSPVVQYVGSSSNCGCDFPHAMFQNGGWPEIDYRDESEIDAERITVERQNRESLVNLLRRSGEEIVELYGVWNGDFDEPAQSREKILLDRILESNFVFKEGGFYEVTIEAK